MRVCMLSYSYYESDNRVRRYAESLAERGDSVDIIAISNGKRPKYEKIRGVNVYRIQSRIKNEKKKQDYLFRVLLFLIKSFIHLTFHHLRAPYDLIHVHSVPDFEVFAALVPRLMGSKIILDIHDIVPEFYAGKFNSGKDSPLKRALIWIERLCCNFSHHVIISNDLWRDLLISRSVTESKCTSIINYPDNNIFSGDINKSSSIEEPFTIIYPGTLNYHQGVDIAVRAMSQVRKAIPKVRFDIYGIGPLLPTLEKLIKELELQSIVFLKNILPLEEIAQKMGNAQLGIVPKRAEGFGNEAFSTKILEFMILGVPVIVSETKIDRYYFNESLVEFFKSGDDKDLSEKIINLYNNAQRRDEMVKKAFAYAIENSWKNKQNLYFDIITELHGVKETHELEVLKNS